MERTSSSECQVNTPASQAGGACDPKPFPVFVCQQCCSGSNVPPPRPALPRYVTILCAGTNIGGGTFWGLCKLLTGMDSFDDILALSSQGDNSNVSSAPAYLVCLALNSCAQHRIAAAAMSPCCRYAHYMPP